MTYSFTKPKIKPPLSLFTKIWIMFFIVCVGIIFSVYSFTNTRLLLMNAQLENKKQEAINLQQKTIENDELFVLLTERKNLALQIVGDEGKNVKIEKVIRNLLGFVIQSGSIRLEYMFMNKNALELKGVTPTKDMFSLLIQTPLKSIFDESSTIFYPLENGWFKFVNINKVLNNEEK